MALQEYAVRRLDGLGGRAMPCPEAMRNNTEHASIEGCRLTSGGSRIWPRPTRPASADVSRRPPPY
jgi:hypothetical protein